MHRIPVTILTGFLGAGKTTILTQLLKQPHQQRIAVVVNEFGEVGIDGALFDAVAENVIELPGGALCCAALGDTTQAMARLLDVPQGIDRVIIETTGLADPLPLMKSFFHRPALEKAYQLDAVVTVIDVSTALTRLSHPEFQAQLATADLVLLNKQELLPPNDTQTMPALQQLISSVNATAAVHTTEPGGQLTPMVTNLLLNHSFVQSIADKVENMNTPHAHSRGITSVYLKSKEPLSLEKVSRFIGEQLVMNGDRLLRYKGIFNIAGRKERFVFQGVGYTFENIPDRDWKPEEERESVLVLIGEHVQKNEFAEAFANCRA